MCWLNLLREALYITGYVCRKRKKYLSLFENMQQLFLSLYFAIAYFMFGFTLSLCSWNWMSACFIGFKLCTRSVRIIKQTISKTYQKADCSFLSFFNLVNIYPMLTLHYQDTNRTWCQHCFLKLNLNLTNFT